MISNSHSVIRTAELDDVRDISALYNTERPFSFLLDRLNELTPLSVDEAELLFSRKDSPLGNFLAIEDKNGEVRGFCVIRSASRDTNYGETSIMFFDSHDYQSPMADETFDYLIDKAFIHQKFNKLVARCLEQETFLREFLLRKGFQSNGRQREVMFSKGKWHYLETLSLFCRDLVSLGGLNATED